MKALRKPLSLFMALLMCLGVFAGTGTTAFAATEGVGTITFARTYDSNGNGMFYNSSANFNGYTAGGANKVKYRMYVDGETAYCIEPGVPLQTGNMLQRNSSETWNALSNSQKKAVGLALLYGRQGNRSNLSGNDDEQWLATQTLVWEFVTGCRNSTGSFTQVDIRVYSLHFGENQPNSGARAVYNQIVCLLQRRNTVPSFMNGGSIEDLQQAFPERKILYVDTLCASAGEGFLVREAARKQREGLDIDQLAQWVTEHRLEVCHWFTVDVFEHLRHGGRVSAAAAVAGSALQIKPLLHVNEQGCLQVKEKPRGRKKGISAQIAKMSQGWLSDMGRLIVIGHGDDPEAAEQLRTAVAERFPDAEIYVTQIGPIIGAHTGPGMLALIYWGSNR